MSIQTDTQNTAGSLNEDLSGTRDEELHNESLNGTSVNKISDNGVSAEHDGNCSDDTVQDVDSESDDYSLSDNDVGLLHHVVHHDQGRYLAESLTATLESVELDKSLALEAQMSGRLNSRNQELLSKKLLLVERLENLQQLYKKYFKPPNETSLSTVDHIRSELKLLEQRVHELKHGKTTMFRHKLGIVEKFPIEYNQAKEKVLERVMD